MNDQTGAVETSGTKITPNGPAWAALLSAGIGGLGFGILTDLSECSSRVSRTLQWYRPAGSLSGVAILAVLIWLAVWGAFHSRWKHQQIRNQRTLMAVTIALSLAALLATFPPFYELLGG
jgi:hypothetical protein